MKNCKLTPERVKELGEAFPHYNNIELARMFNIPRSTVAYYGCKNKWKKTPSTISEGRSINGIKGNQVRWQK